MAKTTVKYGRHVNDGLHRPGKTPDGVTTYVHPLGGAFFSPVGGRAKLADSADTYLGGWMELGFSILGERMDPLANFGDGELVLPPASPVKLVHDAGGMIYYVPTEQAYVEDSHFGVAASLTGVAGATGDLQRVDLDTPGTEVLRVMGGCEGEFGAWVCITPTGLTPSAAPIP